MNKHGTSGPIILGGDANKVSPDEILACHPDLVQMIFYQLERKES
jgi:hypothetical protein